MKGHSTKAREIKVKVVTTVASFACDEAKRWGFNFSHGEKLMARAR